MCHRICAFIFHSTSLNANTNTTLVMFRQFVAFFLCFFVAFRFLFCFCCDYFLHFATFPFVATNCRRMFLALKICLHHNLTNRLPVYLSASLLVCAYRIVNTTTTTTTTAYLCSFTNCIEPESHTIWTWLASDAHRMQLCCSWQRCARIFGKAFVSYSYQHTHTHKDWR